MTFIMRLKKMHKRFWGHNPNHGNLEPSQWLQIRWKVWRHIQSRKVWNYRLKQFIMQFIIRIWIFFYCSSLVIFMSIFVSCLCIYSACITKTCLRWYVTIYDFQNQRANSSPKCIDTSTLDVDFMLNGKFKSCDQRSSQWLCCDW